MPEIVSTITTKGQVTIPVEVRKHLHVGANDKLIFVIRPDGGVEVRTPKYPTVRSMAGVAATLPQEMRSLTPREMRQIAHDESFVASRSQEL